MRSLTAAQWVGGAAERRNAPSAAGPLPVAVAPTGRRSDQQACARIFVAGDRSQVGKSTACLGILGGLLRCGLRPEEVAYIKPATQCESGQLVASFCVANGIEASARLTRPEPTRAEYQAERQTNVDSYSNAHLTLTLTSSTNTNHDVASKRLIVVATLKL